MDEESTIEDRIFDCANCKKLFDGETEVITELKTFVSPSEDFLDSRSFQIVDVLSYIYGIQWNELLTYLCLEEENKYQNDTLKLFLCSQCAECLSILYSAYLNFEHLTNSDSLIKKAKKFRSSINGKAWKTSDILSEDVDYQDQKEDELFDSFNFDDDESSNFFETEPESKYNSENATVVTKSSGVAHKSTRNTRSTRSSSSKSTFTLLPPGKRMVVKLEKISDEDLPMTWRSHLQRKKKSKKRLNRRSSVKKRSGKTERDLRCSVCQKQFASSQNLWKHRQIHCTDRTVQCDICGKVLSSKKYMEKHRRNHKEDRAVNCEICGKLLASKEAVKMHNLRVHISPTEKDMQRRACEICGKMVLGDNRSHMLTHTQEKEKFQCEKCNKTFYSKERLDLHLEAHESTQIFKCSICSKEFPIQKFLDEHHERHHNSTKRFACDKCPIRFANKCHLEKHLIVHSTERPFVCEECGKTFKRINHLKKHVQCHRDEELGPDAFKCQLCGKRLRHSVSFKLHTLQFHRSDLVNAKKVHECTICGRRLFDEKNLKKHYAALHKDNPLSV